MKKLALLMWVALFLGACGSKPKPIEYGQDACNYCKMTIVDRQHASEAVTDKGKVYKFDAIECLSNFMRQEGKGKEFAYLLVKDYATPGKEWLNAKESYYLISEAVPSPMGAFLSAFKEEASAKAMQRAKGGTVYDWESLQRHLEATGIVSFNEHRQAEEK